MEEKQERKKRSHNGERTQKMMSFRLDKPAVNYLEHVRNKGRLMNELIEQWARCQPWYDEDQVKTSEQIYDEQP